MYNVIMLKNDYYNCNKTKLCYSERGFLCIVIDNKNNRKYKKERDIK